MTEVIFIFIAFLIIRAYYLNNTEVTEEGHWSRLWVLQFVLRVGSEERGEKKNTQTNQTKMSKVANNSHQIFRTNLL